MKKRNKVLIITSVVFLIIALTFVILGFQLSGHDVLAWFGSKWAMWFYVIGGLYVGFIVFIIVGDLIKKL